MTILDDFNFILEHTGRETVIAENQIGRALIMCAWIGIIIWGLADIIAETIIKLSGNIRRKWKYKRMLKAISIDDDRSE